MNPLRVQGLLNEIISELKVQRDRVSRSNPELVGAFDGLIMKIETEASKIKPSKTGHYFEKFAPLIRLVSLCIDIISKLDDALFYKFSRFKAA